MKKKNKAVTYLCPHCGNPAPFNLRDSQKPVRCSWCKSLYKKNDRIKELD